MRGQCASGIYLYFPRSINAFCPPDEFKRITDKTGFAGVTVDSLTTGSQLSTGRQNP
jgi:ubiquinone/menaquinone biosynthesis C-methylase UbiE